MQKGEEEQRSKPLEEEPLLAARIVIEDCMCLLLDVDDIDRVLKNHFRGREDEQTASLRVRRIVLLDAMANSLRLPHTSVLKVGGEVGEEEADAVLRRLSGLLKGRKLVSRFLRYVSPLRAKLPKNDCLAPQALKFIGKWALAWRQSWQKSVSVLRATYVCHALLIFQACCFSDAMRTCMFIYHSALNPCVSNRFWKQSLDCNWTLT